MFNINLDNQNPNECSLGNQKRWVYYIRKTSRDMNVFGQTIHMLLSPFNIEQYNIKEFSVNKLGFLKSSRYFSDNNGGGVYNIFIPVLLNKKYDGGVILDEKCVYANKNITYNFEVFELKSNNSIKKIGGKDNLSPALDSNDYAKFHFIPFSANVGSYILFRVSFSSGADYTFESMKYGSRYDNEFSFFIEFLPS